MLSLTNAVKLAKKVHDNQYRTPNIIDYLELENLIGSSAACDLQGGCFENNIYKTKDKLITKIDDNSYYFSESYITKLLAVMESMHSTEEKIVAILQDILETTDIICTDNINGSNAYIGHKNTIKFKESNEVSLNVWGALHALTHKKEDSYSTYILKLVKNKIAVKVKIADMLYSLSTNPSKHAKQKYLKELPLLLKQL